APAHPQRSVGAANRPRMVLCGLTLMDERRHALPLNGATSSGVTTVVEERSATPPNKIETAFKGSFFGDFL
ncbi:MAG TPA: hypothetical protein VGP22_07405, partial [Albitalea sp.]|nr:hypothetical protein [Albitalea sp.]